MSKPLLFTVQSLAANVAARWRQQYAEYADEHGNLKPDKEATAIALEALGVAPDPDAVDEVIGNGTWTRMFCGGCGESKRDTFVEVGRRDEDDSDGHTVTLCASCLRETAALLPEDA